MTDIHYLIIALLLQFASALGTCFYMTRVCNGVPEGEAPRRKLDLTSLLVGSVGFTGSIYIFTNGFLLSDHALMRAFMNAEVFIWLVALGYIDIKERIIPNKMILVGLVFWGILLLVDIFVAGNNWLEVLVFSALGGLLCGGILAVVSLIVKNALGMGDVKMFFVLGLLYGITDTYSILLFSMMIMAAVSIILLILKKVTTKTAVPMAPFVAIGFMLSIIAGM